jgi:23S rRNA A2030 N6-methylase RlmJ
MSDAIEIMESLKEEKKKVIICEVNFENGEESRKIVEPNEGVILIEKAKTIVMNIDEYISHIQVFSTLQKDLENIKKEGIMYDIIFG